MYLLKIAFPYWSNVCFGCDWHILTSELALLSVSQKDENPALFPVISIRCRLAHRPIPFLLLGSLGIGKRCFESRNNNTCLNPFIDGFLVLSKAQQGVLRKPCRWSHLRSRATYSDLRSFLYLRCFGNITVLYLVFQNYRL